MYIPQSLTRKQQILELLEKRGDVGLTVIESVKAGTGTEMRRIITTLRREWYNITTKWEGNGKRKWKRYFLIGAWHYRIIV